MKQSSENEKQHAQCMREICGILILTAVCGVWHIGSAFFLNQHTTARWLGMPAWFSVSVLGTAVISIIGLFILLKTVFVDFRYDEENDCREGTSEK